MIQEGEPLLFDVLVNLLEAKDWNCKWPLWSNDGCEDMAICGKPTLPGHPYCRDHCIKAYTDFGKTKK